MTDNSYELLNNSLNLKLFKRIVSLDIWVANLSSFSLENPSYLDQFDLKECWTS